MSADCVQEIYNFILEFREDRNYIGCQSGETNFFDTILRLLNMN